MENEKKKAGRPRNENFLPWDQAREFVRGEMIPSRTKYQEWWDRNKPKAVPRFPYRVYKEWTSWNDFLGNDNEFSPKAGRKWRPLEEASLWAHSLKLKTQAEWMSWCQDNRAELPFDVPARPDIVYDKWRSWNHWLGNKPTETIEAIQQAARLAVYYLIQDPDVPGNVITFGVEQNGLHALRNRWTRDKFNVVKMFWYNPAKANEIKQIITALSSPYLGDDRQRIVPNVWEVVWHLQMHLDLITPKEIAAYMSSTPASVDIQMTLDD